MSKSNDEWHSYLQEPVARRAALRLLGGVGLVALVGCGDDNATSTGSSTTASSTASSSATTAAGASSSTAAASATTTRSGSSTTAAVTSANVATPIPEETAGPYPGDGSNGPNVLNQSGVVRSDIRSSFGSSTKTASGVPLTIKLQIVKAGAGAVYGGAAVYLWHCDAAGLYSLYSSGATTENYLRGVQQADANGNVTFTSIFPGCYAGRWPHIHFEVFPTLAGATAVGNKIATSQLALPEDIDKVVYATTGYTNSTQNLSGVTLARDNVFSNDAAARQLATMSGSASAGYTASLVVPVKA